MVPKDRRTHPQAHSVHLHGCSLARGISDAFSDAFSHRLLPVAPVLLAPSLSTAVRRLHSLHGLAPPIGQCARDPLV